MLTEGYPHHRPTSKVPARRCLLPIDTSGGREWFDPKSRVDGAASASPHPAWVAGRTPVSVRR